MITNGSTRLNRRRRWRNLCYNISKLDSSSRERKCLADERQNFCLVRHGRDSGHDVGCCVMAYYDSVGCTAQRVQCNSGPIFLGKPDCSDGILHHNSICPYFGGGRSAAEPAIPPAQRPLTPTPEETARRQKSCLATGLLGGPFPLRRPLGRLAEHIVLLEPPRRALSFLSLFCQQNKIPLIGGIYR